MRGPVSIDAPQDCLPAILPESRAVSKPALACWRSGSVSHGPGARRLLSWLLLVPDGTLVCWRRYEPDLGCRHRHICRPGKDAAYRTMAQSDRRSHACRAGRVCPYSSNLNALGVFIKICIRMGTVVQSRERQLRVLAENAHGPRLRRAFRT